MVDRTAADVLGPETLSPPIDPELVPALAFLKEVMPPLSDETLPALRQASSGGFTTTGPLDLTANGKVHVEERQIPGPDGAPELTLLILTPVEDRGPKAALYFMHGGGMVMGDRHLGVATLLPYVAEGDAVVLSVEYRLAPDHPDPAPIEDCYTGLEWTAENAADLGIDPRRLIVVGMSAGGGLATGITLLARDRGFPAISHQVLICPMLDDRLRTHSSRMLDAEGPWPRSNNYFGWTALLGDRRGGEDVSQYAAPARAKDLSGLPRTYIDTASVEVFRDEVLAYAERLSEAGVSVDLHMWGGAFHGSDLMVGDAAISRASVATRDEFIRRAIGG